MGKHDGLSFTMSHSCYVVQERMVQHESICLWWSKTLMAMRYLLIVTNMAFVLLYEEEQAQDIDKQNVICTHTIQHGLKKNVFINWHIVTYWDMGVILATSVCNLWVFINCIWHLLISSQNLLVAPSDCTYMYTYLCSLIDCHLTSL